MAETVAQLVEMGFDKEKAEKAIGATGGSLEEAMEWLIAHQDELEADSAAAGGSTTEAKTDDPPKTETTNVPADSYKCDDCGKLLRDIDAVQFHSAKSGHANFSESTEVIKPLTAEEKAQKALELKTRIAARRKEKEEIAEKEAREREVRRREEGKLLLQRKEQQKEQELRQIAEERRRQKLEDEAAKRRILEQIKADRDARKAKDQGLPPPNNEPSKPQHIAAPAPKVDYKQATIQIRLPSGEAVRQTFDAKEQLSAVRLWIEINHNVTGGEFDLLTSFPRKKMTDDDYQKPLTELGLVPSAVLVMTRSN